MTDVSEIIETTEITGLRNYVAHFSKHSGFYAFLRDNGRSFSITENTFSGPRMEQHMCYKNATELVRTNKKLFYCQGLVSVYGVPIDHAWACNERGEVIEPTLIDKGHIIEYFGIPFSRRYLWNSLRKNITYGLLDVFYNKSALPLLKGEVPNFMAELKAA